MESPSSAREGIIRIQHKMKSTREKWRGSKYDFYLLAHERLYVFRKPAKLEKLSELRNSVRWLQSPSDPVHLDPPEPLEVGVVRDDLPPSLDCGCGDDAVRHGHVPVLAS